MYGELCAFEKEQARLRRSNANPSVSEQNRLNLAKESFNNDVLKKLLAYHNTYVNISEHQGSVLAIAHWNAESADERIDQLNRHISDPDTFRDFIFNTAARSLRLEVPSHARHHPSQ